MTKNFEIFQNRSTLDGKSWEEQDAEYGDFQTLLVTSGDQIPVAGIRKGGRNEIIIEFRNATGIQDLSNLCTHPGPKTYQHNIETLERLGMR